MMPYVFLSRSNLQDNTFTNFFQRGFEGSAAASVLGAASAARLRITLFGCGSKIGAQVGTQVNGTKNENLRSAGGLILTHTHLRPWDTSSFSLASLAGRSFSALPFSPCDVGLPRSQGRGGVQFDASVYHPKKHARGYPQTRRQSNIRVSILSGNPSGRLQRQTDL